ncbi:GTP cyclohydrolase II [Ovoidimarina sediminis]|uniref:GTP cyclohydrolase II n=1 Tax=Ovoidimarina sediminis TaxID=3079856 RepID=UPI0029155510|nr:GTP cyclohydrolase II [Rhodophyticola sp. MJ-SS7]MDU8943789.1 GTP cyclohydrolase II [Rhodophyticola sp. MJ-SS7]
MTLGPSPAERLARARADLRMGVPVVLSGPEGGALVLAAETIRPERLDALRALGEPCLVITSRRAETLKARAYDGDLARLVLPERAAADWVVAVSDPATDLNHPMLGPFETARGGDANLHRTALRLAKSARLLPAALVAALDTPVALAQREGLTCLDAAVTAEALGHLSPMRDVVAGRVPTTVSEAGRVHVFRPDDGGEEHYAVEVGRPDRSGPVLVRIHSACFTGDVLGSLKCDCGPQLHAALAQMGAEGAGLLLYLNQEGRGIGLANKMRAYSLQDQGFDTVEANHRLGFEDDERDFRIGASILGSMGVRDVRLMTNNPAKVEMLNACGLNVVERVPLKVGRTAENAAYLDVKAKKSGHIL